MKSRTSDANISNKARQDAERVFAKVYPTLKAYLMRIVGAETAEDVAQDAFERLLSVSNEFSSEQEIIAWLYRVGHNRAIDTWRKSRKLTPLDENATARGSALTQPEREFLEHERDTAIMRAAASYDNQRRGLLLYYLLRETNLPPEKIAGTIGMAPRTCRRFMDGLFLHIHTELKKQGYGADDF